MDTNILIDMVTEYSLIMIPIITAFTAMLKNLIPEKYRKNWTSPLSVLVSLITSFLIIGFTRQAAVVGIIFGLSSSGLWSNIKKIPINLKPGGPTMKSFTIILLTVIIIFFSVPAGADISADEKDMYNFNTEDVERIQESKGYTPNVVFDIIFAHRTAMQGFGTQLATFKDGMIELKFGIATALQDESIPDYTTIAIGAYIPKFIEAIGGKWISVDFNPYLGITGMFDINGPEKSKVAFYMKAISIEHDWLK